MLEAALFSHDRVPGHVLNLTNDRLSVEVCEANSLQSDYCEIAIAEEKQVARVIQDCGHVRCHEILIFAKANNRGWAIAGGDDCIGFIHRDDRKREHACELRHRFSYIFLKGWPISIATVNDRLLDHDGSEIHVAASR